MTIRKATRGDTAALIILLKEITKTFRIYLGDETIDDYIYSGAAEELIKDNIADIVVGLDNNDFIGFCICKGAVIKLFMVRDSNNIRGLANSFFSMICDYLFCEYDCITLSTYAEHVFPSDFFVRNGFTKKGKEFDTSQQLLRTDYIKIRN